jgi:hypothetical protein
MVALPEAIEKRRRSSPEHRKYVRAYMIDAIIGSAPERTRRADCIKIFGKRR